MTHTATPFGIPMVTKKSVALSMQLSTANWIGQAGEPCDDWGWMTADSNELDFFTTTAKDRPWSPSYTVPRLAWNNMGWAMVLSSTDSEARVV